MSGQSGQSRFFSIENSSNAILILILVIGAVAVWNAWFSNAANFRLESAADIVDALTGLFVAALFMERVQEVIVKAWRQKDRLEIDSDLEKAKLAVATKDTEANRTTLSEVQIGRAHV